MILSCDVVFKKVYILSLESRPFFRRYKNNFDSVVPQEVNKFLLSIHQPSHPLLGVHFGEWGWGGEEVEVSLSKEKLIHSA